MILTMRPPTPADLIAVLPWRAAALSSLRTSRLLTGADQVAYYARLQADASTRMLAFDDGAAFVALGGLEHIDRVNGHAEISLIVDSARHGQGIGRAAVDHILMFGFDVLGLETVWGECYHVAPSLGFWRKLVAERGGTSVVWPRRKRWEGVLYDADLFTFTAEGR